MDIFHYHLWVSIVIANKVDDPSFLSYVASQYQIMRYLHAYDSCFLITRDAYILGAESDERIVDGSILV